jgi:hypothetical protein
MIEKYLDEYELKARIAPGLIVALPVLVDATYAAPILSSWPIFAAGGVCSLALVYGLGYVVRAQGKAVEAALWKQWGGPPSVRVMRYSDPQFGSDLKDSIRSAVAKEFSLTLLSHTEEIKTPQRADISITDAFRRVRQFLRQHDPNGLWSKLNIEYGFCRNLLGSRMTWAAVALSAAVVAAFYSAQSGAKLLNPAVVIGFFAFACAMYIGWVVLPSTTKRIADGYAESAWMAFVQLSQEQKSAATDSK